jgi:hypothetical protein
MHYLRFEEYSNKLELLLTTLKMRALGSIPGRVNFLFFFFSFNIIYVSLMSHLERKKCLILIDLIYIGIYWLNYAKSSNKYGT